MNPSSPTPQARTSTTAVVVVNYGSHDLLAANLAAVSAGVPDLMVVVVDNFSTSGELSAVRELCGDRGWELVASPTNVGYGVGNNLGVAAARGLGADRFLLLNPDATIDADAVDRLVRQVQQDPMTLAAPTVLTEDGSIWSEQVDLVLDRGRMRATRKRSTGDAGPVVEWLSGACLMISEQLWELVGGFDEDYFLYWEDVDLCHRVQQVGGRLEVVAGATAVHAEGATQRTSSARARTPRRSLSPTYYRYNVRNRLLFAAKHLDSSTRRRWRRTALTEAYQILLRGGGRRGLLRSAAPWWAALRGTVEGLALSRSPGSTTVAALLADDPPTAEETTPVRVLQSFPEPRRTTNPYIVMLRDALAAHGEIELSTFTWRRALTGSYDVFHAHWPEILVGGGSGPKRLVRQLLFLAMLVRMRRQRVAIVRTQHNLELPDGISRRERWLLLLFQRWTTLLIRLNESTVTADRPSATIVHGHYRDWFAAYDRADVRPGQLGYFGLIRRYKAVDTLIAEFSEVSVGVHPATLIIGGQPSTADLRSEIAELARRDPRVSVHLEFLSDAELVQIATSSELVVLAYREMHNSGGVLAALSLDRPVLVPDNAVNRALGREVGTTWVRLYPGDRVTRTDLEAALTSLATNPVDGRPDLSGRSWDQAAQRHLQAYRRADVLAAAGIRSRSGSGRGHR